MFRVNATTDQGMPLSRVAEHARRAERLGYECLDVPEAAHNALVAATVALAATTRLKVATSVLVAFPRSPMTVAHAAWDLQEFSRGRFELGLGSQVRGNIVGRYSTPWAAPVPRMREYVQSLRAIFDCWQNGTPLNFQGEHYRFTRMQPFFSPGSIGCGRIPILLGGVGPRMTALAGEVADGLVTHPTNTAPRYVREVIRPRLESGARRAGRDPSAFELRVTPLLATGPGREDVKREREKIRRLLAFLYSTPVYWPSLELFGWRERGEHLHLLTREGRWNEMAGIITDEMFDTFVPSATYADIAAVLREWYGGLTDRITFPIPEDPSADTEAAKVVGQLRTGSSA
jgi:probable F420-dependent oxidoreductase